MLISRKSQYALRACFELARWHGHGLVKLSRIAQTQAIPPRFLEVILGQLKQAGFVESKRGSNGGYMLTRDPGQLSVGDILKFVQGPLGPVQCISSSCQVSCSFHGKCVFRPLWQSVHSATSDIYDNTTLQDLLDRQTQAKNDQTLSYCI